MQVQSWQYSLPYLLHTVLTQREADFQRQDMPKDIGGWQNGQKAYHIRFMNKKGVDILHLKYSKSAANTLVDKYNRLFFNREK